MNRELVESFKNVKDAFGNRLPDWIATSCASIAESHAKEMSIGFDRWENSNYEPIEEGNYQGLFVNKFIRAELYTTDQLYNLYLEHLKTLNK